MSWHTALSWFCVLAAVVCFWIGGYRERNRRVTCGRLRRHQSKRRKLCNAHPSVHRAADWQVHRQAYTPRRGP